MNGYFSDAIKLLQSVLQGDILSPYIFIIVLEVLLLKIIGTKNLEGINIKGIDQRANTYAADSSCILKASENNLRYLRQNLKSFLNR